MTVGGRLFHAAAAAAENARSPNDDLLVAGTTSAGELDKWPLKPFVRVRALTEKPSAPVQLEVVGMTEDSVTLSWLSPERDGGSRIRGYAIECREVGGTGAGIGWTTVKRIDSSDILVACVEGLRVGVSYSFRVYAENDAGSGPPVELRQPVLPRSQLGTRTPPAVPHLLPPH